MNPLLKSLISATAGAVLPGLDALVQSLHPSGGFAATLNSSPVYALLYAVGVLTVHNIIGGLEASMGIHPVQQAEAQAVPIKK